MPTWSLENNIKFNASKCKVLSVTRKKNPVSLNYHLGPTSLLRFPQEKDLGVIVTYNFKWNSHNQMVISKANKMLGLLKRTCPLLTKDKIRRLNYHMLLKSGLHPMSPLRSRLKNEFTTSNQIDSSIEDR